MKQELKATVELPTPVQLVETYQREIALLYREKKSKLKTGDHISKFPFETVIESNNFLSREKLGISYTETDGEITPVWMDETHSFQETQLTLKVLARFAVITNPKASEIHSSFNEDIRKIYGQLRSLHITIEQFNIKYQELTGKYHATIIDYAYKNQNTLIPQLAETLKTKFDSMKSPQAL